MKTATTLYTVLLISFITFASGANALVIRGRYDAVTCTASVSSSTYALLTVSIANQPVLQQEYGFGDVGRNALQAYCDGVIDAARKGYIESGKNGFTPYILIDTAGKMEIGNVLINEPLPKNCPN